MPAPAQDAAPSISQIYVTFDDDCYRAFRRAMARSRRGVVRVEDLLAALAETLPERTTAVLGLDPTAIARLARPPHTGPDLLPMANDPALRSAFAAAYTQAAGQPITPTLLLRALAQFLPTTRAPCRESAPTPPPRVVRPVPPAPRLPPTANTVQAVLRRWLEVQSLPADARDSALQQMASLMPPG